MSNPTSDLTGLWFIWDSGESFRTGQFKSRIDDGAYLIQHDDMTDGELPIVPMQIVDLCDLTETLECGHKRFSIFATRADLDKWLEWLETPSEGKVIRMVKETMQ